MGEKLGNHIKKRIIKLSIADFIVKFSIELSGIWEKGEFRLGGPFWNLVLFMWVIK